jgi:hypothetical protein
MWARSYPPLHQGGSPPRNPKKRQESNYTDEQLPSVRTIAAKLNLLGFRLRTVVKSRPQKK